MRISVRTEGNTIDETIRDLEAVPGEIHGKGVAIVHRNGERANRLARNIAKRKAGPHGKDFFKRISAEQTGLSVEIGPSALLGLRYVGVSGSEGVGRDLDETLVKVVPKFAKDAEDLMDRLL